MKRIEDIEKMDLGTLEAISEDRSIEVPADLREAVKAVLPKEKTEAEPVRFFGKRTENGKEAKPPKRWIRPLAVAASLAAVAVGGLTLYRNAPLKDTYEDPYLAYAEVQKALNRISGSMSDGVNSLEKTKEYIDLPANIIRK